MTVHPIIMTFDSNLDIELAAKVVQSEGNIENGDHVEDASF